MFLFADDTKCSTRPEGSHDCILLQKDMDSLHSRSVDNSIFLNIKKCVALSFDQSLSSSASNLTIKDGLIQLVDHHKDHGVIFSQDLIWSAHYSRDYNICYLQSSSCCLSLSFGE